MVWRVLPVPDPGEHFLTHGSEQDHQALPDELHEGLHDRLRNGIPASKRQRPH